MTQPQDDSPGAKEMQELEALINKTPSRTFLVENDDDTTETLTFKIRKVKAGQIPDLIKAAGPLMLPLVNKGQALDISQLITYHTHECLEVLAVLTKQPREQINRLNLDDLAILFGDCITMNLDFFVQRLLPLFSGGLQRLMDQVQAQKEKLLQLAGQTPLKS